MNNDNFFSNVIKTGTAATIGALIAGIPGLLIGGISYMVISSSCQNDAGEDV